MDLFNKVHIFEPMKIHNQIFSLISLMFNFVKPQI